MVVVACLRGVFFVCALIAACSLGPCSLRNSSSMLREVFVQMAGNSVVDVPDETQAGTICTLDGFHDDDD